MGHNLSPEIREELTNCNNQNNNKKCLVVTLNNDFQFMLEGYTLQTGNINNDLENLKSILSDTMCFILININQFTPQYKWVLLLWDPDENTKNELRDAIQNNANNKQDNDTTHTCAKKIKRENKYTTNLNYLQKGIYCSLKNALVDFLDNDGSVPLYEITNFTDLEKCIRDSSKVVVNDNLLKLKTNVTQKDFLQSTVKNVICENYNLNVDARNSFSITESETLNINMNLLIEDDYMSLIIFTFDKVGMRILSEYLKITNIVQVQHFFDKRKIFYTVYKILDTYTLFFYCDESCSRKEKFTYSIYKPRIIEFLKRKKTQVFLSVEINKLKHLIDFINLDMKKQPSIEKKKPPVPKPKKIGSTRSFSSSKDKKVVSQESNKSKNGLMITKSSFQTNYKKSVSLKKKSYANKASDLRKIDTIVNFKLKAATDKKKDPPLKSIKSIGLKKMKTITSNPLKKMISILEKTDSIKSDVLKRALRSDVKSKKPTTIRKERNRNNIEKKGNSKKISKSLTFKTKHISKIPKKKETTKNKNHYILNDLKMSYQMKKASVLTKSKSSEIHKKKNQSYPYTDSISAYSQINSESDNSKSKSDHYTNEKDQQSEDADSIDYISSSNEDSGEKKNEEK